MTRRRQPGIVAPGLTGTARSPASRCSPQATATLCNHSPPPPTSGQVWGGGGLGRQRRTRLSLGLSCARRRTARGVRLGVLTRPRGLSGAARAGKNVPVAFLVTSVFSWGGWGPAFWLLRTKAMMS